LQYLREVADANARFNIGDIRRNLNTPTLALLVLTDAFRHRFAFRAEKVDAAGTTVLHFEEDVEPTVFQVNAASALSTGRFWVDARTGAVRRTELVLASNVGTAARATITVDYEPVAEAGAWMPLRMTEKYEVPGQRESDWIECTATYSNYKRFSVTTRIK
jgi:hypothetical protein